MTETSGNPSKRYPLQFTIAAVFMALLLLVGVSLIGFNYLESRRIALAGADDLLERSSAHLQTRIAGLYGPVQNLVDLSARALSPEDLTLEQRLESLPFLVEPFRMNPTLSASFIGYADGDFFLVRSLQGNTRAVQMLDAPPDAAFVVQSIDHTAGPPPGAEQAPREGSPPAAETLPIEEHLFLDDDLALLERRRVDWTGFDPRERSWYTRASATDVMANSGFYVFFTTNEIGITMARKLDGGGAVVGADLALRDLGAGMAKLRVTPSSKTAILDGDGSVIALSDPQRELPLVAGEDDQKVRLPQLSDLDEPVYHQMGELFDAGAHSGRHTLRAMDRVWLASFSNLPTRSGHALYLAVLIPRDELLADINRTRDGSILISVGLLLVAVLLALAVSRHISGSLRSLAREAEKVREFKLETPITVRSRIREVDDLATTMAVMKSSVQQFLAISHALSAEKDSRRLLEMILGEARKVSRAEGGAILLRTEDEKALRIAILENSATGADYGGTARQEPPFGPVELRDGTISDRPAVDRQAALQGEVIRVDDIGSDRRYDFRELQERFDGDGFHARSLLSVPLRNQLDEVIGILQLVSSRGGDGSGFSPEIVPYIEALSSDAAVALDIRRLLKAQRDLMDSLVHMIAGAIDAKSPYTHGHCQRVPAIARMLAEAAHESGDGPFAGFTLNEDEWYELHLASWLHDCGKVTTPEYVVDKATKLETIYNRIHEIRMRFEVLWRDAQIQYYKGLMEGEIDEPRLRARLERQQAAVLDDFAFVAECNLGDEPMTPERTERLERISRQTWVRHLDDTLGLSHLELLLKGAGTGPRGPVVEPVLADRPEHVIPRTNGTGPFGDDSGDFRMEVPEHQYNRGEVHNLRVGRGTLTAEERFKINEHVIQSIRMLRRMPFPKELRRVPEWAGNHHEKLDGTGYPRRLAAGDLSVPERIMALADIFEALTATDRPYHAPKTLSQAMRIMSSMCAGGHICPDLFALFVRSGLHREYGRRFLAPEQMDSVDVTAILTAAAGRETRA
jgi:HD-GYP domain-containing protein (c-di-GMP phosphodiesterase class II)